MKSILQRENRALHVFFQNLSNEVGTFPGLNTGWQARPRWLRHWQRVVEAERHSRVAEEKLKNLYRFLILGWSRTWGEEHFGNGKVHKYGKSTTGESWDIVVDEETYYEAEPHYGWADVVGDSTQLLSIEPRERPPGVYPNLDFGSSPPPPPDDTPEESPPSS